MPYTIIYTKQAHKYLKSIPKVFIENVYRHIDALAINPYPPGCIKLTDSEKSYRIRIGDYRVLYEVHHNQLTIQIIKVDDRKNVYR